jgi:hypothetical protein
MLSLGATVATSKSRSISGTFSPAFGLAVRSFGTSVAEECEEPGCEERRDDRCERLDVDEWCECVVCTGAVCTLDRDRERFVEPTVDGRWTSLRAVLSPRIEYCRDPGIEGGIGAPGYGGGGGGSIASLDIASGRAKGAADLDAGPIAEPWVE